MLEVDAVAKSYDGAPVLRGVSLHVAEGTVAALLGPSGCGKTTLLRIIAGLERADAGAVRFAGAPVDGLPPHRRGFGLMFQDYALFPHLDVAGNVAFGLRAQHLSRAAAAARVAEMLELVGMAGYGGRRVYELSGGERQRVALARSLAPRPRLLMLDEPLAALDRELRERLQTELHRILRLVGATALYVTHDQGEALSLADQVVLMNAGRVEQDAAPAELYRRPASAWAARFLGLRNLLPASYRGDGLADTALGPLRCQAAPGLAPGAAALLVIPPDAAAPAADGPNSVAFTLGAQQFRGSSHRVEVEHASGLRLSFDLDDSPGQPGAPLRLQLNADRLYAMEAQADQTNA